MRGKTFLKVGNEVVLHFPEVYDPVNLPTSMSVRGQTLFIDKIVDEICSEVSINSAVGFWLCRTIYLKHSSNE